MKTLYRQTESQDTPLAKSGAAAEIAAFLGEVLQSGVNMRIRVTGRSMAPFLKGGEVVTIKKVPCSDLRRGDLIFFETSGGSLLLHRLVKKSRAGEGYLFQTRGDGLRSFDNPVHGEKVFGKVCRIERNGESPVDMEAPLQTTVNYLRALYNAFESRYYSVRSTVWKKVGGKAFQDKKDQS